MTVAISDAAKIVVGEPGGLDRYGLRGHGMVPVLIGMSLPLLFLQTLAPNEATELRAMTAIGVAALAVTAFVLFILSMALVGGVSAVTVAKRSRKVTVTYDGLLASTVFEVPFSEIVAVKSATPSISGEPAPAWLVLSDGQHLALPIATSDSQIALLQAALDQR